MTTPEQNSGAFTQELPAFYFDVLSGQLLIGNEALDEHIEAGGHPADLLPLGEILSDTENVIQPGTYEYMDTSDWSAEDLLVYGKWLLNVLPEEKKRLTTPVIVQASRMGLGPYTKRFEHKDTFGSLSEFYRQMGLENQYTRGLYDDWSKADFVDYAAQVAKEIKGKPTAEIFRQKGLKLEGPSPQVIREHFGEIRQLLELIGYPNIASWTHDDYVDWGVRFMLANGGKVPTRTDLDALSKQKRGPSARTIVNHFDYLSHFKKYVVQAYDEHVETSQTQRQNTLAEINMGLTNGTLSAACFPEIETEEELILAHAKLVVVNDLLPNLSDLQKKNIVATKSSKGFISAIQTAGPQITAGIIEHSALDSGGFDYIWPMDGYMQELQVAP